MILRNMVLTTLALIPLQFAKADFLDTVDLPPNHSGYMQARDLNPENVYAISCSSNLYTLSAESLVDSLSIHVNPGEVTDRHGQHGENPDYTFPAPVGAVSFFAQPDSVGTIDFNVSNITTHHYFVACNINRQI